LKKTKGQKGEKRRQKDATKKRGKEDDKMKKSVVATFRKREGNVASVLLPEAGTGTVRKKESKEWAGKVPRARKGRKGCVWAQTKKSGVDGRIRPNRGK